MNRQLSNAILILVLAGCSGRGETPSLSSSNGALSPTSTSRSTQSVAHHYGHGPNRGPLPPISDANIDQHIDAGLPEHDKDIMRKLMARMHPSDRYYVMFFDKYGKNYANTLDIYNKMMLARFRGHFPLGGEGSTNGQKTPSHLPTGISA